MAETFGSPVDIMELLTPIKDLLLKVNLDFGLSLQGQAREN
jgi:hypothetical protein